MPQHILPKTPARLDLVGKRILRSLAEHVVVDTASLARGLGASEPAVRDRLHAMREAGLVQGFQVRVDSRQLGASFEFLVTGAPTDRTDRAALARLCADPQVTRAFGLASSHSIAFTVVGMELAGTRAHGLALAEQVGLRQPQAAMVLATFEDRAGSVLPALGAEQPAVAVLEAAEPALRLESSEEPALGVVASMRSLGMAPGTPHGGVGPGLTEVVEA